MNDHRKFPGLKKTANTTNIVSAMSSCQIQLIKKTVRGLSKAKGNISYENRNNTEIIIGHGATKIVCFF